MKALIVVLLASALAMAAQNPARQAFDRAAQALQRGDYAAAETGFHQALRLDPRNIGALGNLGVVYSRTHRYARAIEVYKQALRLSPNDPGILLNLGLAYFKQDNHERALPYFRQLHERDLANRQVIQLLATCLVYTGQPQSAVELLKPLPQPDAGALYLLGVAYARSGHPEASQEVFARFLTDSGTRLQGQLLLGQAYYESRRFEEAEQTLKELLVADPAYPGAHRELGKVCISLGRNEDAQQQLQLALQQDPKDAGALYFLGALMVQSGQYAAGVPYLEQAQSMSSELWAVPFYLGKAKLKLDDIPAAVRYLQQAVEINGEDAAAFYLLANALRAAGRNEEARAAQRRVTELHTSALDAEKRALRDAHVVGAQ